MTQYIKVASDKIVGEYEANDSVVYQVIQHAENLFSVIKFNFDESDEGEVVQPNHDALAIMRYFCNLSQSLFIKVKKLENK